MTKIFAGDAQDDISAALLPFEMLVASYASPPGIDRKLTAERTTELDIAPSTIPERDMPTAINLIPLVLAEPAGRPSPQVSAIQPEIGEDARPFSAGALLVNTALQPGEPGRPAAVTLSHTWSAAGAADRSQGKQVQTAPDGARASSTDMPLIQLKTGRADPFQASAMHHSARPPNLAQSAAATPFTASRNMTGHSQSGAEEPANAASARRLQPSAIRNAEAALPPESGRTFSAQFVWSEGGLRLVLRLPRLSEEIRAELETRLRQMLHAFGHFRHEVLIHHSGRE